jgi:transcriptional regulator with XRE-family HTH domain
LLHNGRRRVPGLRRSELATLAGISVQYVVQLEQGRAATPSAQVCEALARALQLSEEEHEHLMRLAGQPAGPHLVPRRIPEDLHRVVDQLAGNPVAVFDAIWRLLSWNPLFAATFGDPTLLGADSRNAMIWQFEDEPTRVRWTEPERAEFEEFLVADLRATSSRYPRDPGIPALITRLRRSARFHEAWSRQVVGGIPGAAKTVVHPQAGEIALDSNVLTLHPSALRVLVYTPRPGTDARSKLDLLATIGLQAMSAER